MSIILGNGKDGIVYILEKRGREYAVKQFKPHKSINKIELEAKLQQKAARYGISPIVRECNTDKKYIRMDKLDNSLYQIMKKKNGRLSIARQKAIVDLANTLDKIKIFHGDPNPANFMEKDGKLYMIDFGFSQPINYKIIKKYKTTTPNKKYMIWGFLLQCKDHFNNDIKYSYLRKQLSKKIRDKFNL